MRVVSLLEHQTAPICELPSEHSFTTAEIDSLALEQSKIGVEAFRWINRTHIKTSQFVGVLTASNIQLEVLPKIQALGEVEIRPLLVRMIANVLNITLHEGDMAGHDHQENHLLELIIGIFSRKLLEQARRGLVHRYQRHNDDLPRLRGKLNVNRQFTKFAATPQIIACQYDEFGADTPLNRLLLCTIHLLRKCSVSLENQRRLNEIETYFENVSLIDVPQALDANIILGRNNMRWTELETLARLILSSNYQTVHSGAKEGFSLLFDMNILFESYITSMTKKILIPQGFKVSAQHPVSSLALDMNKKKAFYTKPDIMIEKGDFKLIIDTKWKTTSESDRNYGLGQSDIYQMYGYAGVYGAQKTMLLYPASSSNTDESPVQPSWEFTNLPSQLHYRTIDLSNSQHLRDILHQITA